MAARRIWRQRPIKNLTQEQALYISMTRWRKWKIEMHDVRKMAIRELNIVLGTLGNICSWLWLPGSYHSKYLVHPVSNGYSLGKLYKANGVVCKSPSHEFIRLNQTNTTHQCSHEMDQSWDKHFSPKINWGALTMQWIFDEKKHLLTADVNHNQPSKSGICGPS